MKLEPPQIDWTKPIGECVDDANKVVEWAQLNLPEVARAFAVGRHFHLSDEQTRAIALAVVVREKTHLLNMAIKAAAMQPIFIPAKETSPV